VKKKTLLNLLLILFVLSFFVTPLGRYGKLFLTQLFAFAPIEIAKEQQQQITDYDWQLKDPEWNFFNFERSKGQVVVINFWASWRLPSEVELRSLEKLYNEYGDRAHFYFITNEEREPVIEFMAENDFSFPLTYLIIGAKMPVEAEEVPSSYVIAKNGDIVVHELGISDWDNPDTRDLLNRLLAE